MFASAREVDIKISNRFPGILKCYRDLAGLEYLVVLGLSSVVVPYRYWFLLSVLYFGSPIILVTYFSIF